MKYFYPQACAVLRVIFENFGNEVSPVLSQVYTMAVQVKNVRVDINSYTEADTFELKLDYKAFPFDPRTIRSCQVDIHMEDMLMLESAGQDVRIEPTPDNVIFQGFADEDAMTFNDNERNVTLKGRDFTGIFTDAKWPGTMVSLQSPVDAVITDIVSRLKAAGGTQGIQVENRTGSTTLPILARFYPDFGQLTGKRNARKNETYWDVIQDICSKAGLIAYIEIDKLVVTKPRTLYDKTKAIQFIHGRNVKDLEIKRKLAKQKGFNVVVRCVIDKEVVSASIPRESTRLDIGGADVRIPKQTTRGAAIDKTEEEAIAPFISFVVANVRDKNHLIEIGEAIFEEIGRQQIEGSFKTADMEAPADDKFTGCMNLLKMRNGTPIQIVIDADDLVRISREANVRTRASYLEARCYDPRVAAVFAETLGKFSTPFYTRSVSFSLDAQNGFSCDIEFINFIETAGKGLGVL